MHECLWLSVVIEDIQSICGPSSVVDFPTTVYEDNVVCVVHIKKGYIKVENSKYMAPKFFYSHQQQEYQKIEVKHIRSQDNLIDSFTESFPKSIFSEACSRNCYT